MKNHTIQSDLGTDLSSRASVVEKRSEIAQNRLRFWIVRFAEGSGWLSFVKAEVVRAYLGAATTAPRTVPDIDRFHAELETYTFQLARAAFASLAKRALDIIASIALLIFFAPFLLACALAIRLDSHGAALFVSEYAGKGGQPIRLIRFRTMVYDRNRVSAISAALNKQGRKVFKLGSDPRITRIGRFLRRYSLDEIPQLLNVLRGDLSLVGPRPHLFGAATKSGAESVGWMDIKPGLTGLWQVQAQNDLTFERLVTLNKAYAEHWSLALDFKILTATAMMIITGSPVEIVENSPRVLRRPKGLRRADIEVPWRDDEWVVVSTADRFA
jgi:lipopolysaccharide/colanic/teichoic acid biosynthesis glycosyltransferase